MIPQEVPQRETIHDDGMESEPMYPEYWPEQVGHATMKLWGTKTDEKKFNADLRRRDKARAQLGGFGFRA